ncbi:DUF1761 domain-containing protein [Longivirga aurantiaca]|uniref:DUF1761 domain-containing protein n=1 Tax=Longivirga aurantiaca TaxID=1837743 RepID=A0ABW1T359_9ACTN
MTVTIPWLGVLVAFVVAFVANFLWFGPRTMFPIWWRALGHTDGEQLENGDGMAKVFGLTVVGLLVQVLTMSWILQACAALYDQEVTVGTGLLVGALVGAGIAAAASLGHRLFSGQGLKVWAIEVGGDILGLTLIGGVLSFWL